MPKIIPRKVFLSRKFSIIPWEISSQKQPEISAAYQFKKLEKNPWEPVFIDAYLFGEGKRETEKRRKNWGDFWENRRIFGEEGTREMKIKKLEKAANTGLGEGRRKLQKPTGDSVFNT